MKIARLMVVLVSSLGCAAVHPVPPSTTVEKKAGPPVEPADAFYSDAGTPIAGQRYCWIYYFSYETNHIRQLPGWQQCEGLKPFVWERHDSKTDRWVPED